MSSRPRIATIVRLALPVLLCSVLLPSALAAQGMAFHLDSAVLEVLNKDINSDADLTFRDAGSDAQSAKFSEYRDLGSGFRLRELHLWADDAPTSRHFDFNGKNVGRDDARLGLEYGTWGGWSVAVDYNKIVHNFGNDGVFLWNVTAPGHFEIAQPTRQAIQSAIEAQRAANPAGITYPFLRSLLQPFLESANRIDTGLQRNRTDINLELGRMATLGWALEIQHEDRNGTRPYGGSFGFGNAPEIVEPIQFHTDSAELRGELNHKNAGAQFGVRYSRFTNDISTLYWDNPFRATNATDGSAYSAPGSGSIAGAATGFADLAPDNRAGMLFANGRFKSEGGWWANGRVSYQQLRQDDPLLPYTLNSAIGTSSNPAAPFDPTNPANLPVRNADEKVNISDIAANVGTKLGDRMSLAFRYKYYNYDNNSPRIEFPGYVRFHAVWEAVERVTAPYSYKQQNATAELGYELNQSSDLQLSVARRQFDRDFAETTRTNEDAVRISYDTRSIANLGLRASFEHGKRNISGEYDNERGGGSTFPEPESTNLPGMRKYNQAERGYNLWQLQADYSVGDRLTLTGLTQGRRDDYDKSDFGLRRSDLTTYGLELGYAINEVSSLYVFVNRDDLGYDLRSRQSGAAPSTNPADDWSVDFTDKTDTLGIGWSCTKCGKLSANLSASYSKTNGNADFFSPPGGTPDVAFPIANYDDVKLWSLDGQVDYSLAEHVAVGVSWLYEKYDLDSFRLRGVDPFLPGSPLLDLVNGPYRANVFGAHLKIGI